MKATTTLTQVPQPITYKEVPIILLELSVEEAKLLRAFAASISGCDAAEKYINNCYYLDKQYSGAEVAQKLLGPLCDNLYTFCKNYD